MSTLQSAWKAVVAFLVPFILTQLPVLQDEVSTFVQALIVSAFTAVGVWLKKNIEPAPVEEV